MIERNVLLKYQLDFANVVRRVLREAFANDPHSNEMTAVSFTEHGEYHHFALHVGASVNPHVIVIIKAQPDQETDI